MTDEQKKVVQFLVGSAVEEAKGGAEEDEEDDFFVSDEELEDIDESFAEIKEANDLERDDMDFDEDDEEEEFVIFPHQLAKFLNLFLDFLFFCFHNVNN